MTVNSKIHKCVCASQKMETSDSRRQNTSQSVDPGINGKRNISDYRIKQNLYYCNIINKSGLWNMYIRLSSFLLDLDLLLVVSSSKHIGRMFCSSNDRWVEFLVPESGIMNRFSVFLYSFLRCIKHY